MSLFNIRSLISPCVCLLTFVLMVITANVASYEIGADPGYPDVRYRMLSDRNRLEGMTARLDRRRKLDMSRRLYPVIDSAGVSAEKAPGGPDQGPRVTAILDRLRKEYERRINEGGNAEILSQRLGDFSLLENAAELTGPQQAYSMVDSPEPRYE